MSSAMATSKTELEDKMWASAFETVETVESGQCEVTLEYDLSAECPYDDVMDKYDLRISYYPTQSRCLELQSFRAFLDELRGVEASQEALTHFLAHFIFSYIGPKWVEVELAGDQYGIHTTTSKRREQ